MSVSGTIQAAQSSRDSQTSQSPLVPSTAADDASSSQVEDTAGKLNKRRLFGFEKNKQDTVDHQAEPPYSATMPPSINQDATAAQPGAQSISPRVDQKATGPVSHPYSSAAAILPHPHASSSQMHSPASSSIFERSVQESTVPSELAEAIPAHIQTEDHIPPVLEASSLAITDNHLGPDEVEIVTHTAHHPAADSVAHSVPSALQSESHLSLASHEPHHESISAALQKDGDDTASNYGTLDPNDVRRLSFISFADVVQAEHAESGAKDSTQHLPLSAPTLGQSHAQMSSSNRLFSPVGTIEPSRSPYYSQVTTPPPFASGPGSVNGVEQNPVRGAASSSPPIGSSHQHGDLAIQTMRQAVRKTASGDLSGAGSLPTSAVGSDDATVDVNPLR